MCDHDSPEREDLLIQDAILSVLLHEQPAILTMRDLAAEVGSKRAARDAVKELTVIGLLRREGKSVLPTRAAIHFRRLAA